MTIKIGVISDTHIPDRARRLDERVIPIFEQAGVVAILHAGDISSPSVLDQLRRVAPVYATRGNRDWVMLKQLPTVLNLNFGQIEIGMAHGHGGWRRYLVNRIKYIIGGYRLELFLPHLQAAFPTSKVIVFGHTHRPLNQQVNGQLLFNPGSPHVPEGENPTPSVGILSFGAEGQVEGEIVWLD